MTNAALGSVEGFLPTFPLPLPLFVLLIAPAEVAPVEEGLKVTVAWGAIVVCLIPVGDWIRFQN